MVTYLHTLAHMVIWNTTERKINGKCVDNTPKSDRRHIVGVNIIFLVYSKRKLLTKLSYTLTFYDESYFNVYGSILTIQTYTRILLVLLLS